MSSWTELRRRVALSSVILVRMLRDGMRYRDADPVEQYRLGRVALECLEFRRRLLAKRPGPKWKEEKRLQKMEKQVDSIMARLEKDRAKNRGSQEKTSSQNLASIIVYGWLLPRLPLTG